jgi:type 1 fimbria pilin
MVKRRWGIGLVLVLALMAAACAATSINQVLADPGKYRNDTITVRGTVTESASVLGKGA